MDLMFSENEKDLKGDMTMNSYDKAISNLKWTSNRENMIFNELKNAYYFVLRFIVENIESEDQEELYDIAIKSMREIESIIREKECIVDESRHYVNLEEEDEDDEL